MMMVAVGDDDGGPTPYYLLLAAFGACNSMTMPIYAVHKDYKLERAKVRISHDKIHAGGCEQCETETDMIDHVQADILIAGGLSPEERQKYLKLLNDI